MIAFEQDRSLDKVIQLLKALGDPTRFALLEILKSRPRDEGVCVTGLAHRLAVSQPAVSQHLRVLRHLGLVRSKRHGSRVHYTIDYPRLEELREMVAAALSPDQDPAPIEGE